MINDALSCCASKLANHTNNSHFFPSHFAHSLHWCDTHFFPPDEKALVRMLTMKKKTGGWIMLFELPTIYPMTHEGLSYQFTFLLPSKLSNDIDWFCLFMSKRFEATINGIKHSHTKSSESSWVDADAESSITEWQRNSFIASPLPTLTVRSVSLDQFVLSSDRRIANF